MKAQVLADVCIVGGGMVGASAAVGLAALGLKVCLIELNKPQTFDASQTPDLRMSALNHFSLDFLKQHGVWQRVRNMRYRDYSQLDAWENELALTSFKASEIGKDTLGAFVENRVLQIALFQTIEEDYADKIEVIYDHKLRHIDYESGELSLEDNTQVKCAIIIGADGAQSLVRQNACIAETAWDYKQRANLISIKTQQAFADCTWQQFTPSGPLAFLPMHDNFACLVWYAQEPQTQRLKNADTTELKTMIESAFPNRLGDFDVLEHGFFPIRRMHAKRYFHQRAVLLGDAAHTINPLAGQGVNLGFKDLATLIDTFESKGIVELLHKSNGNENELPLIKSSFSAYEKLRRPQNLIMMSSMDVIYHSFSNDNLVLKGLRNAALFAAERSGLLKTKALKYAVGLAQ